jgi:hypothetical protein
MATTYGAKKTAKPRLPSETSAATKASATKTASTNSAARAAAFSTTAATTTAGNATNAGASSSASTQAANAVYTGDAGIDTLIASFNQSLSALAINGRKSLITQKKALKAQTRAAAQERDAYLQQLQALTVAPAPAVAGLSSPEVMQAQRQVAIDAAARKGFRKSIIAGNLGPTAATASAAGAVPSSLMAPSVPGGSGAGGTGVFSGSVATRTPLITAR